MASLPERNHPSLLILAPTPFRRRDTLNQVYREGFAIRKAGVLLNDLELADAAPRRLWDAALYEMHKRLMAAVDSLNAKWGKDAVRCGLFPNSGAWRTRFERRSPAYTTDWRQLMTAH